MLAGLTRALARTCHAEAVRGDPSIVLRPELLHAHAGGPRCLTWSMPPC